MSISPRVIIGQNLILVCVPFGKMIYFFRKLNPAIADICGCLDIHPKEFSNPLTEKSIKSLSKTITYLNYQYFVLHIQYNGF